MKIHWAKSKFQLMHIMGAFTGRAIKQYHVTGNKSHENLIKSFVMIKRSAAIANMKTKAIDTKRGKAIVLACDKILSGNLLISL